MMLTLELFDEIARNTSAGEPVALCVVTATEGSTPQVVGAKMLVLSNGRTLGTLGGGCAEAEVRQRSLETMSDAGGPDEQSLSLRLNHDMGWDDAMVCGGRLDIHVRVIRGPDAGARYADMARRVRSGEVVTFTIESAGYSERVAPPPALVLAGAGHVASAVAALVTRLDFRVTVIDDRTELLTEARFPGARRVIGEIAEELSRLWIDPGTYIVIATRGHARDASALAAVIGSPAAYVGMIGSSRKVRKILSDLLESGVSEEYLARVRAPIGLDIGAVTVGEIAVSIAAELVAVRRGVVGAVSPMSLRASDS